MAYVPAQSYYLINKKKVCKRQILNIERRYEKRRLFPCKTKDVYYCLAFPFCYSFPYNNFENLSSLAIGYVFSFGSTKSPSLSFAPAVNSYAVFNSIMYSESTENNLKRQRIAISG